MQREFTEYMIAIENITEIGDETFQDLMSHTIKHHESITEWIADQKDLTTKIDEFSKPTAFPILFIRCTPHAAERLKKAPGVVAVVPSPKLGMVG